jgi:hypothetical protein
LQESRLQAEAQEGEGAFVFLPVSFIVNEVVVCGVGVIRSRGGAADGGDDGGDGGDGDGE